MRNPPSYSSSLYLFRAHNNRCKVYFYIQHERIFVNRHTKQLSVRGLCLIAQPFVIALSVRFWIFYNGQSILNTDNVT